MTELTQRCIQENARSAQSQEEYTTRYNEYVARYDTAKTKLDALQQKKDKRLAVVEKATAFHDGRLVFTFQNGTEIEG